MKTLISFAAMLLLPVALSAQDRYATRTGHISFLSTTPVENIEAHNHKAATRFDPATGDLEFAVLMKGFEFRKALMQEHFNENYVESTTYPKAEFKGKVAGLPEGALSKPGTHEVTVEGDLTMHGVTRNINATGTITVDPTGVVKAASDFEIKPEDFKIKIPGAVRANIAEMIQVKVRVDLQKM